MHIRGTDFILLPVSDLAAAAKFYREILGLPVEIYSEQYQWAEFNAGNVTLALHGGQPPHAGSAPAVRVALAVADIFAAFAELAQHDVRMNGPPADHGVCRHLEVLDPDGNVVILHQRADGSCGQDGGTA